MLEKYFFVFINSYRGYANYLWDEITNPSIHNYFYWLIIVSIFFCLLEIGIPWRKNQSIIRKDFWLDAFYMFFNFFLFSLIIYNSASDILVTFFNDIIKWLTNGWDLRSSNPMSTWPLWSVLLVGFVVRDFVQWWVHRLLHRVPRLWRFHQVHHSVEQMGFAAHLRYHWMETVVYRTIEYVPLALLGIGLYDFFVIHIFTLAWGHYNHSNISIDKRITGGILGFFLGIVIAYSFFDVKLLEGIDSFSKIFTVMSGLLFGVFVLGPIMKYIFNSPEMHIWHHSYNLPKDRKYGINFGITLAIWDYMFGTALIPNDGKSIKLGYPGVEKIPSSFFGQLFYGIVKRKKS